jgi:hypothetical protein
MTKLALKIIIVAIVLISAGIAWVRIRWAIGKNQREADRLVKGLKDGVYNAGSFSDSLSMSIKVIPASSNFDPVVFGRKLNTLSGRQLAGKYQVQHAQFDNSDKGIIIGEGSMIDVIGAGGSKAVTLKMPCWLLVEHDSATNSIFFKSTVPESSDHHYLQEQFAQIIVMECAV